jgi:hypothetical protein
VFAGGDGLRLKVLVFPKKCDWLGIGLDIQILK